MLFKTSNVQFLKYGDVYTDLHKICPFYNNKYTLNIQNDNIIYFYTANEDIYLESEHGITMLVITEDLNAEKYDEFVIHRGIKIFKGSFFNFLPMSKDAKINMYFSPDTIIRNKFISGSFQYKKIKPTIRINELVAYYYNVRSANYFFPGESNDFWEITIVDNGELHTTVDNKEYVLRSNDVILYAPNQFHKQMTKDSSCSYLTVMLDMSIINQYKERLLNTVFKLDKEAKLALDAFVLSNTTRHKYDNDSMIQSLEKIVLSLLKASEKNKPVVNSTPMQKRFENELMDEILIYINENIYSAISVESLCEQFAMSRSSLQNLFRHNLNISPKEYISTLKLEKSKYLIRTSKMTISEIALTLGFSTIHYFSRTFKQHFGITPTEYANKIMQ